MAIRKIADYSEAKYRSFPSESTRKYQLKEKDYFLDFCKAMLHSYTSKTGNSLIRYNSEYLKKLDSYSKGTQGNKLVKDKLLRKNDKGEYYGKMGKVFQTYDVLPEMLDVIYSTNAKQNYTISSIAIDDISVQTREVQRGIVKFLVDYRTRAIMDELGVKMTANISQDELNEYTDADIDAIFESGGVQLDWEMAAKAACNNVALDSQIKEIENQCTEELIKWGFTAIRPYIDKSTNTPKIRNVDMYNLIVPNSRYKDFRDITRFGEIRFISLIELKELCPSLTKQQYEEIVWGAFSYNINSEFVNFGTEENIYNFFTGQDSLLDEIKVPILEAQWLANDVEYDMYFTKYGQQQSKKVTPETKLSNKEIKKGDRIEKKKFIKRYDAVWLIGSDILLEYGVAKSNSYYGKKGNKVPRLDISVVKTGKKSLVDRCINFVEDINLNVVKLRNAIATLPPAPQLVIYQHSLRNIKINGVPQTAGDLIRGLIEEGVLVANGQDEKGNFISANGGKAVDNLNLHVIEQVTTYSNEIQANINRIRQVLGLPEGLDGTAGNPYQGAMKQQLAAAGSSNALFPILSPIGVLFEKGYLISIGQYQALCTDEDISIKDLSISERAATTFKLSKEFSAADFNVKLYYAPNAQEKEFLINKISELNAQYAQSAGSIGIKTSEYLILYRLIMADRIEEAIRQVARFEKLRDIDARKESMMLQDKNAEVQQNSMMVSEQEKRNTLTVKGIEDRKTTLLSKQLDTLGDLSVEAVKSNESEQGTVPAQVIGQQKTEAMAQAAGVINEVQTALQEEMAQKQAQQEQAMAEAEQQQHVI